MVLKKIPALIPIPRKFPQLTLAKTKLVASKEVSMLVKTNYAAQVVRINAEQRQILDTDVLRIINDLRTQGDFVSEIILIALTTGSRLVEICLVSTFRETENRNIHYMKWRGWLKIQETKNIK